MLSLLRNAYRFGALDAQFQLNKSRNAVRFESQNLTWDYEESNYQTQAFAKGLASLRYGSCILLITQLTTSYSEYLLVNKLKLTSRN